MVKLFNSAYLTLAAICFAAGILPLAGGFGCIVRASKSVAYDDTRLVVESLISRKEILFDDIIDLRHTVGISKNYKTGVEMENHKWKISFYERNASDTPDIR
ncbi:MAG: hypothetical protein IJL80_01260 [Treponema sp.]|nr:hypothetical protein [Treponema sp.]